MRRWITLLVLLPVFALMTMPLAAAEGRGPVHKVSLGSSDIVPPGEDANLSLIAIERADGAVTGQWHDQFGDGTGVHLRVTCLEVEANQAWVSGVITKAPPAFPFLIGLPAVVRISDNGTAAIDPPDQVSFPQITGSADDCLSKPDLPLFDLTNGQARVW